MATIHESDVVPTLGAITPLAPTRAACAEAHINPWLAGTKGTPQMLLGTPASLAAGIGLLMVPSRLTAASNAPAELVLGDTSGGWVINLTEYDGLSAAVTNFNTVFLP